MLKRWEKTSCRASMIACEHRFYRSGSLFGLSRACEWSGTCLREQRRARFLSAQWGQELSTDHPTWAQGAEYIEALSQFFDLLRRAPTTDTEVELANTGQRPAWLAAVNYVELLAADASRIRACAHPDCVLHFYDTSPKRSRRWCSMAS